MKRRSDNSHGTPDRPTLAESEKSLTAERALFKRREVLASVGAVLATPVGASTAAYAAEDPQNSDSEDSGYGAGAYGDGPFGDPDDGSGSGDEPTAGPQIVRLDVEDPGNQRDPHADVYVEWEASIDDGELESAEITISDFDSRVLVWTYDLSGQSVTKTATARSRHGAGETYDVELTVEGSNGTSDTKQTSIIVQ